MPFYPFNELQNCKSVQKPSFCLITKDLEGSLHFSTFKQSCSTERPHSDIQDSVWLTGLQSFKNLTKQDTRWCWVQDVREQTLQNNNSSIVVAPKAGWQDRNSSVPASRGERLRFFLAKPTSSVCKSVECRNFICQGLVISSWVGRCCQIVMLVTTPCVVGSEETVLYLHSMQTLFKQNHTVTPTNYGQVSCWSSTTGPRCKRSLPCCAWWVCCPQNRSCLIWSHTGVQSSTVLQETKERHFNKWKWTCNALSSIWALAREKGLKFDTSPTGQVRCQTKSGQCVTCKATGYSLV